jgi:hypothetical protein
MQSTIVSILIEVKSDVSVMAKDVADLKSKQSGLEADLSGMKHDLSAVAGKIKEACDRQNDLMVGGFLDPNGVVWPANGPWMNSNQFPGGIYPAGGPTAQTPRSVSLPSFVKI